MLTMSSWHKSLKLGALVASIWLASGCVHSNPKPNLARDHSNSTASDFDEDMEKGKRHSLATFGMPDN